MSNSIHVGDTAAKFFVTVKDCDNVAVDVSTSTVDLFLVKPSKVVLAPSTMIPSTKSSLADGTDGQMMVTITSGIDEEGSWHGQPRITDSSGGIIWGSAFSFRVKPTALNP